MKAKEYVVPTDLLCDYSTDEGFLKQIEVENENRAEIIYNLFNDSNIPVTVEDVKCGSTFTRYEISVPNCVSLKSVFAKYEDLNLWLNARNRIRMVAPVYGSSRIGIEVPHSNPETVGLKALIESQEFKCAKQPSLSFCLGRDVCGNPVVLDIAKMPHLLIAGATGTGKSVFLNSLLVSLIYKYSPEELRLILVDPKRVEFSLFKGIPHLLVDEIFTDNANALFVLEWLIQEMDERYKKCSEVLARNINEYNIYAEKNNLKKLPNLLVVVDEFTDLTYSKKEKKLFENAINRLLPKSRAAGIHLIMATQRITESVESIPVKTNFTSRVAFKTVTSTESNRIMGQAGAETLVGRGDLLFRTSSMSNMERAQGAYVSSKEVLKVCNYLKENFECSYEDLTLTEEPECVIEDVDSSNSDGLCFEDILSVLNEESDLQSDKKTGLAPTPQNEELIKHAMRIAISTNNISISTIQRKLAVGFPKAAKILDALIERGYISDLVDFKSRNILMTKEQFEEIFGEPF